MPGTGMTFKTIDQQGIEAEHPGRDACYEWIVDQPAGSRFEVREWEPGYRVWRLFELNVTPEDMGAAS